MDRRAWLRERQAAVEATYDAEAATYDEHLYPAGMQRRFVTALLATCPPDGLVLDAPCGTGRYFPLVAEAGRRVVGIDASAGMLERARAQGIAVELHRVALQDLAFVGRFDAAMTIDAMENVAPEDWPQVLARLHRAVRPGGRLYLTVEEVDRAAVDAAFAALTAAGAPAVHGEIVEGDVAGYHYYPERDRVMSWLAAEGLTIVEEDTEAQDDWAYWHLLVESAPVSARSPLGRRRRTLGRSPRGSRPTRARPSRRRS